MLRQNHPRRGQRGERHLLLILSLVAGTVFAMFGAGCTPAPTLGEPPLPEDLDDPEALDFALAEWVWKLSEELDTNRDRYRPFLNLCLLYQANDVALARPCLEQVVQAYPERIRPQYFLARAVHDSGDLQAAVPILRRVVERAPDYTPAALRLADWLLEAGQSIEADAVHRRSLQNDPENPLALAWPDWDKQSIGSDPWSDEIELFRVARAARLDLASDYREAGQPLQAIRILEDLHQQDPRDVEVLTELGAAFLREDRLEDARGLLELALQHSPDDYGAHVELASLHQLDGRSAVALEHVDQALAARETSSVAHGRRGAILRSMKRFDEALESFRAASELAPDEPRYVVAVADIELQLKRWEAAAGSYTRALALAPEDAQVAARSGLVQLRLGRLAEAETLLNRALTLGVDKRRPIVAALAKVRQLQAQSRAQDRD